ncbi:hypothetical protein SAMN05661080_01398 [Modestobacter sp. DSM 44400]|uniref:hypothetical protein n=1 Tax=Modestobacter sp. DSM 44400 TaxID=1550230 RepID=UPI00089A09F0|nr:hypothetical protein [Modestobacter sp. DSM 44400]SDX83784.1 hypothetical protein SAMN05661080_01398 [Modestobacter sp. DSM 44400]
MTGLGTALRWAGAVLLAGIAVVHGRLWLDGYRTIEVIGPLFALDTVLAALLAGALVVVSRRLLPLVALAGAALAAGTAAGLLFSTQVALFGFSESLSARHAVLSLVLEVAATVVLLALAATSVRQRSAETAAAQAATRTSR